MFKEWSMINLYWSDTLSTSVRLKFSFFVLVIQFQTAGGTDYNDMLDIYNFQCRAVGFEQRLERIPGDCSQDGRNQVAANHDDKSDDDVGDAQERAGEVGQQVHPGSCLENQLRRADGLAHVPGCWWWGLILIPNHDLDIRFLVLNPYFTIYNVNWQGDNWKPSFEWSKVDLVWNVSFVLRVHFYHSYWKVVSDFCFEHAVF